MQQRFCPKCGAYWQCDCRFDVEVDEDLSFPSSACDHDWVDAVGVELDPEMEPESKRVLVCRLCGLYAVEARAQ